MEELRRAHERATVLGDLKAEGAARLSEAATEAALQSRSDEVSRAEAEVQKLLAALAARESQVAARDPNPNRNP